METDYAKVSEDERLSGHKRKIDFDRALSVVGSFGKYQIVIVLLICFSDQTGLQTLSPIFIAYTPEYYCEVPYASEMQENCTVEEQMLYSIPIKSKKGDKYEFDQCRMYSRNETDFGSCSFVLNETHSALLEEDCKNWHYDTSVYKNSVVSEVNIILRWSS